MKSLELIQRMLSGESASQVLDEASPPILSPFAIRKYIRQTAPGLYSFLEKRGDLHDFSLRLVDGNPTVKDLLKQQEIPTTFKTDLEKLIAGLEES